MAHIDEIKEEIGAIKTYLGFIVAFIITVGAGVSKLYLDSSSELLLFLGLIGIVILAIIFAFLAKVMHKKIKSLKDIS
jgi:capsular polysaccharide biosynthesis protein